MRVSCAVLSDSSRWNAVLHMMREKERRRRSRRRMKGGNVHEYKSGGYRSKGTTQDEGKGGQSGLTFSQKGL